MSYEWHGECSCGEVFHAHTESFVWLLIKLHHRAIGHNLGIKQRQMEWAKLATSPESTAS